MSDWEDEMEKEAKQPTKEEPKTKGLEVESEEIIKTVKEYKPPPKEQQNKIDYEEKYNVKNQDLIKSNKEIESAVSNIQDDELKLKKKLELQKLKQTEDFLGNGQQHAPLSIEKDFIDLAKSTAAMINEADKPSQFTYSFLKYSTDLLIPSLPSEKINDLMKSITAMFNKKLKDENTTGKGKTKKPAINSGKLMDRIEKTGVYADYGIKKQEDEEDYEEDDFM